MEELVKKEEQLIFAPIENFIIEKLMDGFKNRKDQDVIKVDGLSLARLECDTKESEFKIKILINRIDVLAKVWVNIGEGARSNNQLSISINKQVNLVYNYEDKLYQIENEEELNLFDRTPY